MFSPTTVLADRDRKKVTGRPGNPYRSATVPLGSNAIGYGTLYRVTNARACRRPSTVSIPTKVTLLPTARATLAIAAVSCLQGPHVEDQKFSTIGLPARPASAIVLLPLRLGRLTTLAGP